MRTKGTWGMVADDIRALVYLARACGYTCLAFDSIEPMDELRDELRRVAGVVEAAINDLAERERSLLEQMDKQMACFDKMQQALVAGVVAGSIGEFFDPQGFFVYILWGNDPDTPVYVGKSANILSRLGTHMADRKKHRLVERVQLISCRTESAMSRTEELLIRRYRPQLNVAGVPDIANDVDRLEIA